jgi:hypothetical protein
MKFSKAVIVVISNDFGNFQNFHLIKLLSTKDEKGI